MTRNELGSRLLQWHSSMSDPIYAVGSFYISGKAYPDKEIAEDAVSGLDRLLSQFRCMSKGEDVIVIRHGKQVDLKKFAGYTNSEVNDNILDLKEIVANLKRYIAEDYT